MKPYFSYLCFFFLLGATSCAEQRAPAKAPSTRQAFDLTGYLDQEVKNLAAAQPAVTKTVLQEGQVKETKTFNQVNWAEELGAFTDADINKPALKGLYTVEKTTNAAGQSVHRYQAKAEAKANVREVTFTFGHQNRLLQVDATIVQENMLFNTQKLLHLELNPETQPRLQRYRLEETQKLLLMGEEKYAVAGKLALK